MSDPSQPWLSDPVVSPDDQPWLRDALVKGKPTPAPEAAPEASWSQNADRQTSLLKRALMNAAVSPATMVGGALNKFINGASSLVGHPTNLQTPQELFDRSMDSGGMAKPQGFTENLTQDLAKSAPTMAMPAGMVAQVVGNAAGAGATSQSGNEDSDAAWGGVAGAVPKTLATALRLGGNAATHVFGTSSGAGAESVKQAFKDAPGFVENMRGKVSSSEVVDSARQGVENMRQKMYDAYKTAKGGWASDTTPLDFKPVGDAINAAVDKFSFKGVPQPGVAKVKVEVEKTVEDWLERAQKDPSFLTVEGMDALKRHLNTITPNDVENRTGRAFVTSVVDSVKESIIKQRPDYAPAMREYWASTKDLDEITRSLSLGDKSTVDTALRKLQSLMRNNVNSNFGSRIESANKLLTQGGVDIMPQVAGQAVNSWTPRGLQSAVGTGGVGAALMSPKIAMLLPTMSPRIVGESARYIGKGAKALTPSSDISPELASMLAAALRNNDN